MTMPIPSGLTNLPVVEIRRDTEITAPNATSSISGISPFDAKQVLKMPEPVVTADQASNARDGLQRNFTDSVTTRNPASEPSTTQAALLKLSESLVTNLSSKGGVTGSGTQINLQNASTQNSDSQTATGTTNLSQLIDQVLSKTNQNLSQTQAMNVPWPATLSRLIRPELQSALLASNTLPAEVKKNMLELRDKLKTSGLFAAERLGENLMPSLLAGKDLSNSNVNKNNSSRDGSVGVSTQPQAQASGLTSSDLISNLLSSLGSDSTDLTAAIQLALSGKLVWEGNLAPNLPAKILREDVWQGNPEDPTQLDKGTKISVQVTLEHLGSFNVIGTQFGEQLAISIQTSSTSKSIFQNQLAKLNQHLSDQSLSPSSIQVVELGQDDHGKRDDHG